MALSFVPPPGTIVICNFDGYVPPEMVKKRRVIIVSPLRAFKHVMDATAIVVPLSEVEPLPTLPWHHRIPGGRYSGLKTCWAKADLVAHVGLTRLDRIFYRGGWIMPMIDGFDLVAVRRAVTHAIGLALT